MPRGLLTARTRAIALHTAIAVGPSFWLARGVVVTEENQDVPLWLIGVVATLGLAFVIMVIDVFAQLATKKQRPVHPIVLVLPVTMFAISPAHGIAEQLNGFMPAVNRYDLVNTLCLLFALALGITLARWYVRRIEG